MQACRKDTKRGEWRLVCTVHHLLKLGAGTVRIANSTISGNIALGKGGGLYASSSVTTLTIRNSTISGGRSCQGFERLRRSSPARRVCTPAVPSKRRHRNPNRYDVSGNVEAQYVDARKTGVRPANRVGTFALSGPDLSISFRRIFLGAHRPKRK